jgi:hypothetical protein
MSNSEEFAFLYPAVLVAYTLSLTGKSLRLKKAAIELGIPLHSFIKTKQGNPYYLPTERVFQYISLMNCLSDLRWRFDKHGRKIAMIEMSARLNFFGTILDSVGIISPDLRKELIVSGVRTNISFYIRRVLKR